LKISDTVIVALIATVPPTITAAGALIVSLSTQAKVVDVQKTVEVVHKATNSLTDRLVAVTRSDALQEGHTEGVEAQRAKQKPGLSTNVKGN